MLNSLYQQFSDIAQQFSEKKAVISRSDSYSYKDLLLYSESIALNLQDYIKLGERVGVIYSRSHELIALILAILRIGACYVPIDPRYPLERIKYMVDDAGIKTIICRPKFQYLVPNNIKSVTFDAIISRIPHNKSIKHSLDPAGNDLAYIIYTSGTTGQPKGVMIQNHCVSTLLESSLEQGIRYQNTDKWTMFHSYAFDFSIWEIFGAILSGATLHIIDNELMIDIYSFYEYLRLNQISILSLTPSVFKQLIKIISVDGLPDLRYIVFGGERFDLFDYQKWVRLSPHSKAQLVNMYGITETTVHTTLHFLQAEDINLYHNESPIGVPLKHFDIFLLDNNLQPVKEGEVGEIYVAGTALAKGYFNKPDFTAERFIPVPAHLASRYTYMYKSGDLAHKIQGILCYKGRSDNQIKLRGYRIELDEIEKALLKIPKIKNSSVMVDERNNFQVLVAFYEANNKREETQIKKFLHESLPSYMLPDEIFYVEKMPVTINGKVNKTELKKLYIHSKTTTHNDEIALNDPNQQLLLKCWQAVLGDKLLVTQNSHFFKSGGYSLLTFRLLAEINKLFHVDIKIECIHAYPIFSDMLAQIILLPKNISQTQQRDTINSDLFPATYNQQSLYYSSGLQGSSTYNICFDISFNRFIAFDLLQSRLAEIINKNQEFRTTFTFVNGILQQLILPPISSSAALKLLNITLDTKERLVNELAQHEFNLNSDYLFDFHYLQISATSASLFLNIHHTIFDGTSLNLFINELANSVANHAFHIKRNSFLNYASYQLTLLRDNQYVTDAKLFWHKKIDTDVVNKLKFSDVKAYRAEQSNNHYSLPIEASLISQVDAVCAQYSISPYIFYLLAYGLMLKTYTGETKFSVGVPYANRPASYMDTYGYFINTLPIVFNLAHPNTSIKDIFRDLNALHLQYLKFQELPLSIIMENHHANSINTFFAYQRGIFRHCQVGDLEVTLEPIYNKTAKFDLFLAINELSNMQLEVTFEFEKNILSLPFIQNLASYYLKTLLVLANSLSQSRDISINDTISSINNNKAILKGNTITLRHNNLVKLFHLAASKFPHEVAIFDEVQKITYQELNVLTDKLAKKFIYAYGSRESKLVGMYFRRDINMPIYILAILKAGFAYIPLNEEFPPKRIEHIRELSDPIVILTNIKNYSSYLSIEDFVNAYPEDDYAVSLPTMAVLDNSLAYVMFTSGTTGQPKGVSLGHCSLANRISWMKSKYNFRSSDVMLMKTPFNFDVSCGEIFSPLISGSKLFVSHYLAHKNIEYIIDTIVSHHITHMYFVPTMLNIFLQFIQSIEKYKAYNFKKIKMIFCSGEALNQTIVHECYKVFPHIKLYNQYGPTEAGEVSDYLCKLHDKYQIVPIGTPINNTTFFIIDKNQQLVSQGIPGELLISGECLADGYYNQELLTKQKFSFFVTASPSFRPGIGRNPETGMLTLHGTGSSPIPGEDDDVGEALPFFPQGKQIVYKTGDLVVLDQEDNLCFLERMDNQTKINGIRIELGEIEQALLANKLISQVFVCIHREAGNTDKLIAFYVTINGEPLAETRLQEYLNQYLPQYMLPTNYFHLSTIPTNLNGKIDRNTCIQMFLKSVSSDSDKNSDITLAHFNQDEQKIITIWSQLLNRDISSINLRDNFLLSGGSSLLISRLILELDKQLKFSLNMFDIITQPTLINLLNLFKHGRKTDSGLIKILSTDLKKYSHFSIDRNLSPLSTEINTILVTGTSGFIGRNTLLQIQKIYPDALIICMQRNCNILNETRNIKYVQGDLEKVRLGLSDVMYNELTQKADVIIHIAATVNHLFGYYEHRKANVLATRDIINLALTGKRKRLIFISTTGASQHNISSVSENELSFIKDNGGYLLSKMIAEKLIYIAAKKYNLCATILRLGFVGPNIDTYDINYSDNHLYALFKSLYCNKHAPDNFGNFECLAVNDVAQNIITAIKNKGFNINRVANQQVISWKEVYQLFTKISGIELALLNKNDWIRNIIHKADPIKDDYLYKLIPLYQITNKNSDKNKNYELAGDIKSSFDYEDIVKSYICAIKASEQTHLK